MRPAASTQFCQKDLRSNKINEKEEGHNYYNVCTLLIRTARTLLMLRTMTGDFSRKTNGTISDNDMMNRQRAIVYDTRIVWWKCQLYSRNKLLQL